MISISKKELNVAILCSFRYALGRMTYIVPDVVALIIEYKEVLNKHARATIVSEIDAAIENGTAGMKMDVSEWLRVVEAL